MIPKKKLWIGLFIMLILSPLGIIIPKIFNAQGPWGEWKPEELTRHLGYIPEKLLKLAGIWKPLFPDYSFGDIDSGFASHIISYVLSGVIGIILIILIIYIISRLIINNEK
ncbi:MAG: cobalamin biosynthesis protein [Nitrospirae bacterium]|nr:cobalamin biosynthesis protein [Nitrospirota bacterium]